MFFFSWPGSVRHDLDTMFLALGEVGTKQWPLSETEALFRAKWFLTILVVLGYLPELWLFFQQIQKHCPRFADPPFFVFVLRPAWVLPEVLADCSHFSALWSRYSETGRISRPKLSEQKAGKKKRCESKFITEGRNAPHLGFVDALAVVCGYCKYLFGYFMIFFQLDMYKTTIGEMPGSWGSKISPSMELGTYGWIQMFLVAYGLFSS